MMTHKVIENVGSATEVADLFFYLKLTQKGYSGKNQPAGGKRFSASLTSE